MISIGSFRGYVCDVSGDGVSLEDFFGLRRRMGDHRSANLYEGALSLVAFQKWKRFGVEKYQMD